MEQRIAWYELPGPLKQAIEARTVLPFDDLAVLTGTYAALSFAPDLGRDCGFLGRLS